MWELMKKVAKTKNTINRIVCGEISMLVIFTKKNYMYGSVNKTNTKKKKRTIMTTCTINTMRMDKELIGIKIAKMTLTITKTDKKKKKKR